ARERERIAALRSGGRFFWMDISLRETTADELATALDIPRPVLDPLIDFSEKTPPSRKFHTDGQHVVFAFSCFLESAHPHDEAEQPLRRMEVQVLVTGDYILTAHEPRISLPDVLSPSMAEARSEQYIVYAILDSMVSTGFDALNEAELTLEGL